LDYFATYSGPVGTLLLVSDGTALTGLYMNREAPSESPELPLFRKASAWLDGYFRGQPRSIDFPLKAAGTAFQQRVWKLLQQIPFGETRTYGQLARELALRLGKEKMSAQAVGQAVGKNPISILIPCHRVVGAKGQLTGYAGGIENKAWLLRHEGWEGEST